MASLSTTCRGESKETARAEANQVANDGAQVGQRFGRRRPATGVVAKRKIGIYLSVTGADGHCLGGADTIANVRGNFYAQDLPARGQTGQTGAHVGGAADHVGARATLLGCKVYGNVALGCYGCDEHGAGVHNRGNGCASRAQTRVSIHVCANGAMRQDVHAWAGEGGRTSALVVTFAAQKGPLSPAAGLGPIHGMSRAARSKAHALSG